MRGPRLSPSEMRVLLAEARAELGSPGAGVSEHGPRVPPAPGVGRGEVPGGLG